MKLFGSLTELVSVVFRKNSNTITLRPNQSTTYTGARDIQTPPQDADSVIVSQNATQPLTNKTLIALGHSGTSQLGLVATFSNSNLIGQELQYGANDTDGVRLSFIKTRGTTAYSKTAVSNGDTLGIIRFRGTDGTTELTGAVIQAVIDSTVGTNDLPTSLVFQTTADGASTPTTRLTISNTGLATFATGIALPTGGDTLSAYDEEGTLVLNTLTNSAAGSLTVNLVRVGRQVTGTITAAAQFTATASAPVTVGTLPTNFRPATATSTTFVIRVNGTFIFTRAFITTAGLIDMRKDASGTAPTAGDTFLFDTQWSFTYYV